MGRAHHDGQQLEHLPETWLGEEARRASGRPKKLAVAQFGFEKNYNRAFLLAFRVGTEFSPLPSLSSSLFLLPFSSLIIILGLQPTGVDTGRSRLLLLQKTHFSVWSCRCNT